VLDPSGVMDSINTSFPLNQVNQLLESMRQCKLEDPYKPKSQTMNYNKWLIQTQDTAWLKT
jgi:hypothetical protein